MKFEPAAHASDMVVQPPPVTWKIPALSSRGDGMFHDIPDTGDMGQAKKVLLVCCTAYATLYQAEQGNLQALLMLISKGRMESRRYTSISSMYIFVSVTPPW